MEWDLITSSGKRAVDFSSFIDCEIRNDSQIMNAPVEQGSFASYNKVTQPVEISLTLGLSGTDAELQSKLDAVGDLKSGTELLSVVTPNAEYQNMNITGYAYQLKRENGRSALWVEIELQEVKEVTAEYTNVRVANRVYGGTKTAEESWSSKALSWVKNG